MNAGYPLLNYAIYNVIPTDGRRVRSKPPLHCKIILEEIIVNPYLYK